MDLAANFGEVLAAALSRLNTVFRRCIGQILLHGTRADPSNANRL